MIDYSISSKIIIGKFEQLYNLLSSYSSNHILLLTNKSLGDLSQVKSFLNYLIGQNKLVTHRIIQHDAPISLITNIRTESSKPDLIIAIGGGSVIDSAKAISVAWNKYKIEELILDNSKISTNKIPVIVMPTTAGTGAELSHGAILLDEDKKIKCGIRSHILVPEVVLIDIDLYKSAPIKLKAEVGFDCLTHAIETYLSTRSNSITKYTSVNAIKTVFQHFRSYVYGNEESLLKMAITATFMGANLAYSTTCLPHRIQYILGPETGTSHAQGLLVLYKGWLPLIKNTSSFEALANELGLHVNSFVEKINEIKSDFKIDYSLSKFQNNFSKRYSIAERVTGPLNNDPCYKGLETIIQILENSQ